MQRVSPAARVSESASQRVCGIAGRGFSSVSHVEPDWEGDREFWNKCSELAPLRGLASQQVSGFAGSGGRRARSCRRLAG